MRGARWLLLVAILILVGGVAVSYRLQRKHLEETALEKPSSLPLHLTGAADDWQWSHSVDGRPVVEIRAKEFKQEKDSAKMELGQVQLKIFKKGNEFDLVKSARAEYYQNEQRLYSEGDVEITLDLPNEGEPRRAPVSIKSSGVTFESATGRASTTRLTEFTFENGHGKSIGSSYDPQKKELVLMQAVELYYQAPEAKAMKLESGELVYKEADSQIWLRPWAKLSRENTVIEAADTIVHLSNGVLKTVDAQKAHGSDRYPKRTLEYAADQMQVTFSPRGEVEHVAGQSVPNQNQARLISASETTETKVTSDRIELDFDNSGGESALTHALATGKAAVESKPLPAAAPPPETRLLAAETIDLKMRAGGHEIESLQTHAPGRLEFLPNLPAQHHRVLDAERMTVYYGPENRIQRFESANVKTETQPTAQEKVKNAAPSRTASRNMMAEFDPKTGQMARMEQWDDFTYEEGGRRAKAQKAALDSAQNIITLEIAARLWDATGATSADHIRMDQKSGDFTAEGHVNSSRLPDNAGAKKDTKKSDSGLLSTDQPLQAVAQSMTSRNRNRKVLYEKNVVMWQSGNRITADRVDIDRDARKMTAAGNVYTQFAEDTAVTTVKSERLIYTEADRLAYYTGSVLMNRPALQVKAAELKAYLAETDDSKGKPQPDSKEASGQASRLEKAFADGAVEILQASAGRTRRGLGEHGEYYTDDEKIILRGGDPQLIDSKRGNTRGQELTYFVNDDRLLVSGAPAKPAASRLRRN